MVKIENTEESKILGIENIIDHELRVQASIEECLTYIRYRSESIVDRGIR